MSMSNTTKRVKEIRRKTRRKFSSEIENESNATDEQIRTFEAGMGILQNALEEFQQAATKLENHATSLH